MIDHLVLVGGENVSDWVKEFEVEQNLDSDSDPGKIKIILANSAQKFTNHWPPQITEIEITAYNWVYRQDDHPPEGTPASQEYLVATGKLTDNNANHTEAELAGECDLGHLSDALKFEKQYGVKGKPQFTPKEIIYDVIAHHTDTLIEIDWDPALDDINSKRILDEYSVKSDDTFQSFLDEMVVTILGGIYYFNERNRLQIKDPYSDNGVYNLDPYVTNPMQTTSLMGFKNVVVVIGDESKTPGDPISGGIHGTTPIIAMAKDDQSISEVGWLVAPAFRDPTIKDPKAAQAKADQLLTQYHMYKNALTTPEVVGIVPPLQSIVEYSPFVPVSDEEVSKYNAYLVAALARLQAAADAFVASWNADPANENNQKTSPKLTLSSQVRGIVVGKRVNYSIDGLKCVLTISPGLVDGKPITNDDITGSILNYTTDSEGGDYS